jgi:hypothetical protein
MASLDEVCSALAEALGTIGGLREHEEQPDTVNCPAAWPMPRESEFHDAFDEGEVTTVDIVLVVAPLQDGYARGQRALNAYLARSGTKSIKAAIETAADTSATELHGLGGSLAVKRWHSRGLIEVADVPYWGAKIEVEIQH